VIRNEFIVCEVSREHVTCSSSGTFSDTTINSFRFNCTYGLRLFCSTIETHSTSGFFTNLRLTFDILRTAERTERANVHNTPQQSQI
jgi:hypothetical protein